VWAPAGCSSISVSVAGRQHLHSVGLLRGPRHRGPRWYSTGQLPLCHLHSELAGSDRGTGSNSLRPAYIATNELAYLMIAISTPGTLWADDFALSFAPGNLRAHASHRPDSDLFFGMHVENSLESTTSQQRIPSRPMFRAGVNNPISGNTAVNWLR